MTLFMIGLGLCCEKDITVLGLETLKKCDLVFLESYTSLLQISKEKLEKFLEKEVIIADRRLVEKDSDIILNKEKDVAFLVIGDPMCATTHIDLMLRAKEKGIKVEVIHNASIVSAIGIVGLEVYKYGKITSIPFHNSDVKTPIEVYSKNMKIGLHTLFLLDLDPINNKFLSIRDACRYLIKNGISEDTIAIGCARIGSKDKIIKAASLKNLVKEDFGKPPYCMVIPGNLHFMEEDALQLWKD